MSSYHQADDPDSDPEFSKPLHHRHPRFIGASIKRKRIDFVPQSRSSDQPTVLTPKCPAGDRYLSIVLPSHQSSNHDREDTDLRRNGSTWGARSAPPDAPEETDEQDERQDPAETDIDFPICHICHLPVTNALHTSSLAHQVCLPHVHPPSNLDRHRKGIAVMSIYGYDPDARLGLGAAGDGRLYPIQPQKREKNWGVGTNLMADAVKKDKGKVGVKDKQITRHEKVKKEQERRAKEEKMRSLIFGKDEVNAQLGVIL